MKEFFSSPRLGWGAVCLLMLGIHFTCGLVGWNHNLLEHHSYRQSQTAMAVEYMLKDSAWVDYLTPVLGPPWQVPFEFPLYQMIVAATCLFLHTPIDQTGRAISLMFFYASLWPMNLYLRVLVPEKKFRFMMLSLVLIAPVYIYYSRAVMIESTALFFGFSFLALVVGGVNRPSLTGIAAILATGSLCALVKITTFCAFCFPCLLPLFLIRNENTAKSFGDNRRLVMRQGAVLFPAFLLPFLIASWWTHRVDAIKLASPTTEQLTSLNLVGWTLGSWTQRMDASAWLDFSAKISFGLTFYPFLIAILFATFFIPAQEKRIVWFLVASGLLPPLVFFNLHVVHDYYFYASSTFLIFALGYILGCLMRERSKWGKPLWGALALSFLAMYAAVFFRIQRGYNHKMDDVVRAVQENSAEGDYLLIYGENWDPKIPYHAHRKALMNYFVELQKIKEFDLKMDRLQGWEKIRLAIVNTSTLPVDFYLTNRLLSLGFPEKPTLEVNGFSIYRRSFNP